MMGALSFRRGLEWLLGLYFLSHIPITLLLDLQAVLPRELYPVEAKFLPWKLRLFIIISRHKFGFEGRCVKTGCKTRQTFGSPCGVGSPTLWDLTKGTKRATSDLPASFLRQQPRLHRSASFDLSVIRRVGPKLEPRLLTLRLM
ncbi:sigma intracellular receptor 2 isoform X2 [Ursus maritimus]|uniref:Sigma intracellular receptor 2 isoform X2 n=1 Tax=Ursus maritimus TaxID=29073 RepID=A0A8M1GMP2_URSMA|nr:sigma intracellular receptor 2 isoform X2 [Ursus maritimus]